MRLPILTYHDLDEVRSPVTVAPSTFRQHMARLRAAGYTHSRSPRRLPGSAIQESTAASWP